MEAAICRRGRGIALMSGRFGVEGDRRRTRVFARKEVFDRLVVAWSETKLYALVVAVPLALRASSMSYYMT